MTARPPPDLRKCAHENFAARVEVSRLTDTGCFAADVRIECSQCKEPFRFLGVPPGISFERPAVSIDGLELRAPIEPEGEKRLFSRATFEMPPRRERES